MESIATNLELQLSELEMLRSMFPGEGELCLDDPAAEAEVNQWINGEKKDLKVKDGVCSSKQFLFPNYYFIIVAYSIPCQKASPPHHLPVHG